MRAINKRKERKLVLFVWILNTQFLFLLIDSYITLRRKKKRQIWNRYRFSGRLRRCVRRTLRQKTEHTPKKQTNCTICAFVKKNKQRLCKSRKPTGLFTFCRLQIEMGGKNLYDNHFLEIY